MPLGAALAAAAAASESELGCWSCVASLSAHRFDARVGLLGAGGPLDSDDPVVSTVGGGGKARGVTATVVLMVVDKDRAENAEIAPWTWGL